MDKELKEARDDLMEMIHSDNLRESTLSTRIEDFLWADCDNCRTIRLGMLIGSVLWSTTMAAIVVGVVVCLT